MFSFFKHRAYLDWAAAAPISRGAKRAFLRALGTFGNPSSPHKEGHAAHVILEEARTTIARELQVKADDIIFTANGTEANNLAITGHVRALIMSGRPSFSVHFLYLPGSHASITKSAAALSREGVLVEPLCLTASGEVDTDALKKQIRPETALVSINLICGETGTRFDARAIRRALDEARAKDERSVLLHVDVSQAPLTESIERARILADLMTFDAQKIGGVRGIGALVAKRTVPLLPLMRGGGQERGLRSGTESHALAAAFAVALKEVARTRKEFRARAMSARALLIREIKTLIPDALINQGKEGSPHILNVSLPGRDTDYLATLLDEAGYAVSTRSACETGSLGSRAVLALTQNKERAQSTVRISWGPSTSSSDLASLPRALHKAVQFLDNAES